MNDKTKALIAIVALYLIYIASSTLIALAVISAIQSITH